MKGIGKILSYLLPYKWYVVQNFIYNILGAVFTIFSFAMVVPFLGILFNNEELVTEAIEFSFSTDYFLHMLNYSMSKIMSTHGANGALALVSAFVIVASILKNVFVYAANHVLAPLRAYVTRDMRNEIYAKVLRLPLSYYTEARKGDVMTRISSDVQEIETSVLSSLQMFFRDPITIIIFLVVLLSISVQLTIFVLVLLPLTGLVIGRVGRSLRRNTFTSQERLGTLMALLEETLGGLRIVKAFNAEGHMQDRFERTNQRFARLIKRVFRRRYMASPISELMATVVLMIILAFGGSLVLGGKGNIDGSSLILYLIIFSQIIVPAKNISVAWVNVQKGMASLDRVNHLLLADDKILEKEDPYVSDGFKESIEFRNVSFRYDKDLVLKHISFKIEKGKTVALVGKSGSGKSTLVDLLPRFMDVLEGQIFIDGVDVSDYSVTSLRSLMGMVSQQSILFNDSFRNNISFGSKGDAGDEDIVEAAKVANADDFIMDHPNGYEDTVGEGGSKLSGGQRQRISIARAVMANPPILILDEATSALDTESERLVQDAIIKLMQNRTSIVIAHRLSTIKHADQILVLDEGEIVERGTHEELIKNEKGVYHKLHSLQMY